MTQLLNSCFFILLRERGKKERGKERKGWGREREEEVGGRERGTERERKGERV